MAKKLNSYDRRKLLEARDKGLSNSEMKRRLGITDDRTLRRHLELAEREQEPRVARTEVLKEAIRDHLAELRQLIENWKAEGFRIPAVTDLPSTMTGSMELLHSNRLFACLKDHLPSPTLWRDYNQWEAKYRSYIDNCDKLREEIRGEAVTQTLLDFMDDSAKLSHLSSQLIDWILLRVEYKLKKVNEQRLEFRWKYHRGEIDKQPVEVIRMSIYPSGQTFLELFSPHEVNNEFYEEKCRELLYFCLKGGTVANLSTLLDDLRYLETKIHNSLEEILLRRDYILYTCNLCPGRPRLLR